MTEPSCVTTPAVAANAEPPAQPASLPAADGTAPNDGTSSLPFTGADFEGIAVVGGAGVLAGALLLRRRRAA